MQPNELLQTTFDRLKPADGLSMRAASLEEIDTLYDFVRAHIPGKIASRGAVRKVVEKDSDSICVVTRDDGVIGLHAALFLNARGAMACLDENADMTEPDSNWLCNPEQPPVAIYYWVTCAPRTAGATAGHLSVWLRSARLRHAPIYCRAVTAPGIKWLFRMGFTTCDPQRQLYYYPRLANNALRPVAKPLEQFDELSDPFHTVVWTGGPIDREPRYFMP